MNAVIVHSEQLGLVLNCKKTDIMATLKEERNIAINFQVKGLKQVNCYSYLCTAITSDEQCLI